MYCDEHVSFLFTFGLYAVRTLTTFGAVVARNTVLRGGFKWAKDGIFGDVFFCFDSRKLSVTVVCQII